MKHKVIALAGPPCSGKSSSGRKLAELLSVEFVETDAEVEAALGKTIEWLFENHGEAAFRAAEKRAVQKLIMKYTLSGAVISLGGGTLLDSETSELVRSKCTLFTLWTPFETLLARNTGGRPLAVSDGQFRALLLKRKDHYQSLPGRISTEGLTPCQIAETIAGILRKEDPALWSR